MGKQVKKEKDARKRAVTLSRDGYVYYITAAYKVGQPWELQDGTEIIAAYKNGSEIAL